MCVTLQYLEYHDLFEVNETLDSSLYLIHKALMVFDGFCILVFYIFFYCSGFQKSRVTCIMQAFKF